MLLLVGFDTHVDLPHVTVLLPNKMNNFYMEPTLKALNLLKKKELTEAASHYGLARSAREHLESGN